MKKRFVFYREFWVNIFIWGIVASGCVPLLQTVLKSGGSLVLPLIWVVGIAAVAFLWFRSYCEFREEYLLVVLGPVFEKYYYSDITGIKSTKGIWLVAGPPKIRFAIFYNSALRRYISPRDGEGFLELFREKCPDASVD